MKLDLGRHSLVVVVGAGGVGKTTIAAALGTHAARSGRDTLVMTFDPSLRLKDTLGVGAEAKEREVRVPLDAPGSLSASLLDPKATFDRLVRRYAPDEAGAQRILTNRFYANLAGTLAGILEYMAVERLFEVATEGRYACVVLDTPPTRQALDFLGAPERIIGFLDSGALKIALKPWFDDRGRLRATSKLGFVGRGFEGFLDRIIGLDLLRDMAEFFQAFGPLFDGFRERATNVQALLRAPETLFVLVSGPGEERIPETVFFARKLVEAGHQLGPVVVNMVHPAFTEPDPVAPAFRPGLDLLSWLGARDAQGIEAFRKLLLPGQQLVPIPLRATEPARLADIVTLGADFARLAGIG